MMIIAAIAWLYLVTALAFAGWFYVKQFVIFGKTEDRMLEQITAVVGHLPAEHHWLLHFLATRTGSTVLQGIMWPLVVKVWWQGER